MITVQHKFLAHQINPATETLLIGTFNPDAVDNNAEFFYGRSRNYLWQLLPSAFGETDLKGESKQEKIQFIGKYKIDLIDLIEEIQVDSGQEANYDDSYIDSKVIRWRNVMEVIDNLSNLKRVCFTRKTFLDIPHMKSQIDSIKKQCDDKGISFKALITPARFYNINKQSEWTDFLLNDNTTLSPKY